VHYFRPAKGMRMERNHQYNALKVLSGFAELFAGEAGAPFVNDMTLHETVTQMVDYVKTILHAERVCAIIFFNETRQQVFFSSDHEPFPDEEAMILAFTRRVTADTASLIRGDELPLLMTTEEEERFRPDDPVLFPVAVHGRLLGVFWVDGCFNGPYDEDKRQLFDMLLPLIRLGFCMAHFLKHLDGVGIPAATEDAPGETGNEKTLHTEKKTGWKSVDTKGLVDVPLALSRLNGSIPLYRTILTSFLKHSGFEELQRDVAKRNIDAAIQSAHSMKTACSNLSLTLLYHDLQALETCLENDRYDPELYNACIDSYKKTREAIIALLGKI
jgi:HPt (histidine-containing phosphotransfer) domain-containing protein